MATSGPAAAPGVKLPIALYWAMVRHARRENPREACGLIAGVAGQPVRVVPATNIDPRPVIRYQVAPKDIIAFDRLLETHGWEWHGVYHSHTFSEAYPSPTDIANAITAFSPTVVYYIVSLRDENIERPIVTVEPVDGDRIAQLSVRDVAPPVIRAFFIADGAVTELPITFV
ncbi:MAG: M67 family metallopeptidase [Dehalococcoidia bacterium]|nr:M67 family metallopeptidase [Dehalococcoidia bacterium]